MSVLVWYPEGGGRSHVSYPMRVVGPISGNWGEEVGPISGIGGGRVRPMFQYFMGNGRMDPTPSPTPRTEWLRDR